MGKTDGGLWVHNACIALDNNALVALLEGSAEDRAAVLAVMRGRTPVISITTAKEFLAYPGRTAKMLRDFLGSTGGRIGAPGDASVVAQLLARGVKPNDARSAASAIREGTKLITRDSKFRNKIPKTGLGF